MTCHLLRSDLKTATIEIKDLKQKLDHAIVKPNREGPTVPV
jgi:hypothetical protein